MQGIGGQLVVKRPATGGAHGKRSEGEDTECPATAVQPDRLSTGSSVTCASGTTGHCCTQRTRHASSRQGYFPQRCVHLDIQRHADHSVQFGDDRVGAIKLQRLTHEEGEAFWPPLLWSTCDAEHLVVRHLTVSVPWLLLPSATLWYVSVGERNVRDRLRPLWISFARRL